MRTVLEESKIPKEKATSVMGRGGHFHIEAVHQTLQANVPFGWSRALGVLGSTFGESLGTLSEPFIRLYTGGAF